MRYFLLQDSGVWPTLVTAATTKAVLSSLYRAPIFVLDFFLTPSRPLYSACEDARFKVTVSHLDLALWVFLPSLSGLADKSFGLGAFGEYLNIS